MHLIVRAVENMLHLLDLFGTLAFAISGAFRAVRYEMDILGVIALAIVTGIGGGLVRDTLLGRIPPVALLDQRYFIICIAGALIVFFAASKIAKRWDYVMAADAVGLAVFASIGCEVALITGAPPLTAITMAVVTACGGGVIRDLSVNEIPAIFTQDLYASAAILGGVVFIILDLLHISRELQFLISILAALVLRGVAMRYRLSLPTVKSLPESPSKLTRVRKLKDKD
ncbi:MAG: trimeric intracellular cation channel family protein [Halieaceae bacterium]|nr:trimeric intracellular cation channel family protein [Halieaceae bacterium]